VATAIIGGGRTPSGAATALGLSRTASLSAIVRRCIGGGAAELHARSVRELLHLFATRIVREGIGSPERVDAPPHPIAIPKREVVRVAASRRQESDSRPSRSVKSCGHDKLTH
jgi:hypothetical protein